ncbi:hypothetical protein OF83DRAFT_473054 [Amylostereum chailletii]|nr:hypothetical protein OF83DRAFT_473054 [Amylostereum chailletii]
MTADPVILIFRLGFVAIQAAVLAFIAQGLHIRVEHPFFVCWVIFTIILTCVWSLLSNRRSQAGTVAGRPGDGYYNEGRARFGCEWCGLSFSLVYMWSAVRHPAAFAHAVEGAHDGRAQRMIE